MKSLLVDALRQAEGDAQSGAPEEGSPGSTPGELEGKPTSTDPESPQLDLLATGAYEPERRDKALPSAEVVDANSQNASIRDPVGTNSNAEERGFLQEDSNAATQEIKVDNKPVLVRVGRLTPVLCLLSAIVAALAYWTFSRLAVSGLNEDLADISERLPGSATEAGAVHDDLELSFSEFDSFEHLLVVDDEALNTLPSNLSLDTVANADVEQYRAADRPKPEIALIRTSNTTSNPVVDQAYETVRIAYDAYRLRDYSTAETHYLKALAIEPNHRGALVGIAAVYQKTGMEQKALRSYEQLLSMDPGNTAAAAAVLSIRSTGADWEGESELKLLLQRLPAVDHLHFSLGSIYIGQERWPEATFEFMQAHELAPENADYSYNLAVSLERSGDYEGAKKYFEAALATADDHSEVNKAAVAAHIRELSGGQRDRS